jgi:hypothetical protein
MLRRYVIGTSEEVKLTKRRARNQINNGEFDPGSGRTLAACLTHASQLEVAISSVANG